MVAPRLVGVRERMDEPGVDPAELHRTLKDLARVNRTFGGTRAVLRHLDGLCTDRRGTLRLLDVGTGYADIPRAVVRWARARELAIEIDALEPHPIIRGLAARACADYPEIHLREGNGLALPYSNGGVDVAFASQILHHLEGDEPVRFLAELDRVARCGVVVSDLRRGAWPYLLTRVTLSVLSRSPLIRQDGPLSIRRGFTPQELVDLARAAGWEAPRVYSHSFFRLVIVDRKS
jgi:ubiquinone/menaquinone biosynthesis C-methylase UbiE